MEPRVQAILCTQVWPEQFQSENGLGSTSSVRAARMKTGSARVSTNASGKAGMSV